MVSRPIKTLKFTCICIVRAHGFFFQYTRTHKPEDTHRCVWNPVMMEHGQTHLRTLVEVDLHQSGIGDDVTPPSPRSIRRVRETDLELALVAPTVATSRSMWETAPSPLLSPPLSLSTGTESLRLFSSRPDRRHVQRQPLFSSGRRGGGSGRRLQRSPFQERPWRSPSGCVDAGSRATPSRSTSSPRRAATQLPSTPPSGGSSGTRFETRHGDIVQVDTDDEHGVNILLVDPTLETPVVPEGTVIHSLIDFSCIPAEGLTAKVSAVVAAVLRERQEGLVRD